MRQRIAPPRLRKGDCIGIIAPASAASSVEKIERGISYLERRGFLVKPGCVVERLLRADAPCGYLAASDDDRARELNQLFSDRSVRAVFSLRGGYGSPRLLRLIDYGLIKKNPKIFVGYSDITALHLALQARSGLITFSGPMVAVEMKDEMDPATEDHFWSMLMKPTKSISLTSETAKPRRVLPEKAHGILLGGNLTMIASLLGTKYTPRWDDAVLFLEDVGEKVYRIDRSMAQLGNASVLSKLRAVLLGYFTDITHDEPSLSLHDVWNHSLDPLRIPIFEDMQFGHAMPKVTLPHGALVTVDARKGIVVTAERVVS